ncbi:hypothetical protein ACFOWM_00430 [Ferruginibacter yonginensis]|uniref:Lipocalin-like domain-containing protein n=1 Tax=Ferruginibacter yonginensis TaxID=1310416 RepID=A0ABV8QPK7_9BACT
MKFLQLMLISCLICFNTSAQKNNLIGTWSGKIYDEYDLIWDVKVVISGSSSAEIYLYDEAKSKYISYLSDPRFNGQKRSVSFQSQENFGTLTLSYESSVTGKGQSVYNMIYDDKEAALSCLWSNNSVPFNETSKSIGVGYLYNSTTKFYYSGTNLVVGGQSYSYIKISEIKRTEKSTVITFKVDNTTSKNIVGTFHEPGHKTAFYITDENRSTKYKLIGSDLSLPYQIDVAPNKTKYISLIFEPIPTKMTLINVFEGGEGENLWKFFDVRLKD